MTDNEDEKTPELKRQGSRRNAGADTPSGPNTERSATPARRERGDKEPSEIMPSASPETVKAIEKEESKSR